MTWLMLAAGAVIALAAGAVVRAIRLWLRVRQIFGPGRRPLDIAPAWARSMRDRT